MSDDTPMILRDVEPATASVVSALLADYENQIDDLEGRVNNLAADKLENRARIRELEAEVSRLRVELEATQDDRDEARHTLRMMAARIKNVHQQYRGAGSPPDSCTECNRLSGYEVPYPCPTLQALDGES